ncbi:MAG: OsmC family protein [Bacteroidota bacterium]|nr:OsmC family protein [Flavisolibacter sp.]MDQ3843349.1 OsmC family protein [Bacteroidota bacterium]MBD0286676.1 OsmC family protein [Flavisolibacter sp.]MBD0297799.1 OsmC family protein [Flavisolibacter sp.]MBD0352985.1 OsmC family protein [Flavisolibacter sp.]
MKTITTWKSGETFESSYHNGTIEIDSKQGFSPKALLLSGLAGCAGVDMVMILEKMRVPFAGLVIDVETEQTDTPPRVFKEIYMTFRIKTGEENRDKVKRAIDLSLEKYCGVAAMLKKHSGIHYQLNIIQE